MRTRHPSRQRLQRWLETGESRRVDRHVDDCAICQEALDELSALDEDLVADLQTATSPPADITERTHGGVDSRLRDEAALAAFLDLFAVGWEVARCVLDPTTDGDDAQGSDPEADNSSGGDR